MGESGGRDGWIDRGREAGRKERGRKGGGGGQLIANCNCITGVHVGLLLRYGFVNLFPSTGKPFPVSRSLYSKWNTNKFLFHLNSSSKGGTEGIAFPSSLSRVRACVSVNTHTTHIHTHTHTHTHTQGPDNRSQEKRRTLNLDQSQAQKLRPSSPQPPSPSPPAPEPPSPK